MKVLFFDAIASSPKAAAPLMGQTGNVLRAFERYVRQAVHTAKQRQTRYQLRWERVNDLVTIQLEPVDSILRVARQRPGVILEAWPADKAPDLDQMGFVLNRGVPFRVESTSFMQDGLHVCTDEALSPTDNVVWCGVQSNVVIPEASRPPRDVCDASGRALVLRGEPDLDEDEENWLLVVEGSHDDCVLVVDGEESEAISLDAYRALSHVTDANGNSYAGSGSKIRTEEAPADGLLVGNNGIRYCWRDVRESGRRGCWVQLLPPDSADTEDFLDPRAAFCEGDVQQVWTQPRHRNETTYKVKKVDQDRYQLLLEAYPPPDSVLYLPVDVRNLYLQRRALKQLMEAPLPHHQGLLRLCEDPKFVRWPKVQAVQLADDDWLALTDVTRSGTDEQRRFVQKALGTPDLAILEGPPGSGKTTAICEIVQQLVAMGQRVLLCASTHVAIDNVLERLLERSHLIDAVRIGKLDKVDDKVQATQLDERVDALMTEWRRQPSMSSFGDIEMREMAERTVIMGANLTCGTTMGIVHHPLFRGRDEDLQIWERPIATMPHWDVLIVDEASKTLIQEFMVPAVMAKRWIVVGDVRQLPPFTDRSDIMANLRDLVDSNDTAVFPPDHQRACTLLFRLLRRDVCQPGMRWLIVERPGVLEWLAEELAAYPADVSLVRVVAHEASSSGPVEVVTYEQLVNGEVESLRLAAADWVLVGDDLIAQVEALLPANLLRAEQLEGPDGPLGWAAAWPKRQAWWLDRVGRLPWEYKEKRTRKAAVSTFADAEDCESDWLQRNDWAQQATWRLTRLHELRRSRNDKERDPLRRGLAQLKPQAADIDEQLAEIEDIGLPSILEVLQEGIGAERAQRNSALTAGLKGSKPKEFAARFESLTYQHRMHADIASFPRDVIYAGDALRDANTITSRDAKIDWDFGPFRGRRAWAQVNGNESGGVNQHEIDAMEGVLWQFIEWAKRKGPPARDLPKVWEVACLCFYTRQERAISDMLRKLTRDDRRTRFEVRGAPIEIVCGTVDRFQGREADLVLLSMRNTSRIGFLDSPNRLNVAVTRARQQLLVFGNADYFKRSGAFELEELAKGTPLVAEDTVRDWRRGRR